MGPTAVGKTDLALYLCKNFPIDLISVDSGLIYKYMNIGTGKLNSLKLLKYPHRLVNILDPLEKYSALQFKDDALLEIDKILKLGRIPLLVGGTMLYYKVLLQGLSNLPPSNLKVQKKILYDIQKEINLTLHLKLQQVDPISAKMIHPNDHKRLLRALEVFFISGKRFSDISYFIKKDFPFSVIQFALRPKNKKWLYNRIVKRFKNMLDLGFQREMEYLFYRGDLNENLPSMNCIGYKQMWDFFSAKINFIDMCKHTIIATMQLAKKQMTWLHNWQGIHWLSGCEIKRSIEKIFKLRACD
ncbi:tRNA (adenosine(37)-N6)-dimethylallyltransferase MiaA [Buchnera aphidicola (Mollitrichosiphum nigrofasciatum)]|uniref:tRNA (adenosine(37)-N6)-dimethylallyltransferase MiaA n=1 Tax=Buchnera aphidicola TaxID=9 RepID=UPI0031B87E59